MEKVFKKKLSKLYELLSEPMTNFDCGELCAKQNDGIPHCCDSRVTFPVLYRPEFEWHQKQSDFWKPLPLKCKTSRKYAEEMDPSSLLAVCPGPAECSRKHRAIVCRVFPFEPYLDQEGNLLGLVYNYEQKDDCPLVGRPKKDFNPKYLSNSMAFWKEVFEMFPCEKELYMEESEKVRRAFKRKKERIEVF